MVNISRVLSREATTLATAAIAATVYQSVVFSINSYAVDVRNKFGDDISSLYGMSTEIDNYNAPLLDGILVRCAILLSSFEQSDSSSCIFYKL
jgi:hypothetical protein